MRQFFVSFVVVVLVVAGAGFVNYHRNAPLDQELEDRPYARYGAGDLEALLLAHTTERDRLRATLSRKSSDPTNVMNGFADGDFDGKVNAFDEFQVRNQAYKRINGVALEHQVEIELLEHEMKIRERGLDDPRQRILRRILTF
ncbi:MAG: hypothetical protein JRG76_20425 [Deltaproteobacteria bacterium]|nr:hypothetical protein [Deltaproteobacteria bacterium]MBW2416869.1 hypothetical protein [Deltaproteobacteria bacterium]